VAAVATRQRAARRLLRCGRGRRDDEAEGGMTAIVGRETRRSGKRGRSGWERGERELCHWCWRERNCADGRRDGQRVGRG
jgi:hypothetical protein